MKQTVLCVCAGVYLCTMTSHKGYYRVPSFFDTQITMVTD